MTDAHPTHGSDPLKDFLAGRPMTSHRSDATYLRRGRHMLAGPPSRWLLRPGWQRQMMRLAATGTAATVTAGHLLAPAYTDPALSALAVVGGVKATRAARGRWRMRRFRRVFIRPTQAALAESLDAPFRLHVDPSLGNLVARAARDMSPAERAVREWYGLRVEPVVRWLPDRVQRGAWVIQQAARPVTSRLAKLRPERAHAGPRIEVRIQTEYLSDAQTKTVSAIVKAKIPAGELLESWDQVGNEVKVVWKVRRRPPTSVGYADVEARIDQLEDHEFFVGLGVGGVPFIIDLEDDSPHIAVSAGSGAGKTVLAQLLAVQVLRRGGRVLILDRKGSHRWARGLPGVTYCLDPEEMHPHLIEAATVANRRNREAFHQPEGWDPGARVLVVAEELNATIGQLRRYWAEEREKGDPDASPAITALAEILQMGRSAKVNMVGIAQMLTARAIGGPEARENFGVRGLARFTRNAWTMLCDGVPQPRASRTRGRWWFVVAGAATEVQVAYLSAAEARRLCMSPHARGPYIASERPMSQGHAPSGDIPAAPVEQTVTLTEAIDGGLVVGSYEAVKKRLQRDPQAPQPVGSRGTAGLYRVADLMAWGKAGVS